MSHAIKPPDWKSPVGLAICFAMAAVAYFILF